MSRTLNETPDGITMTVPLYAFLFAPTEPIQPVAGITTAGAMVGTIMQRAYDADNGLPYYNIVWRKASDYSWVSHTCERADWIDASYVKRSL